MTRMPALALLLAVIIPATLHADCDIRVMLSNTGTVPIEVRPPELEVRSQSTMNFPMMIWGTWRRAQNGGLWTGRQAWIVQPGQVVRGQYLARTLCSDAREMRVLHYCVDGHRAGQSNDNTFYNAGFLPGAERVWNIPINGDRFCISGLRN